MENLLHFDTFQISDTVFCQQFPQLWRMRGYFCMSLYTSKKKKNPTHPSNPTIPGKQKLDFSLSLQNSCHMARLPDRCQFNSTAVSEEVYSESAINFVWHLKGGVVNLSLEYLVLVEVCIQNTSFFLFDLFHL